MESIVGCSSIDHREEVQREFLAKRESERILNLTHQNQFSEAIAERAVGCETLHEEMAPKCLTTTSRSLTQQTNVLQQFSYNLRRLATIGGKQDEKASRLDRVLTDLCHRLRDHIARLRQELQHRNTEATHLKQSVDERMAHLEEGLRTKGYAECDSIWKAHEALHHIVTTDKHSPELRLR